MKCRVCSHEVKPFMSFGKMPIANGFLLPDQFSKEYFFNLSPVFCETCLTFQIEEQPAPEMMFHEKYAFFSRTSSFMRKHFNDYANWVCRKYLTAVQDSFVVEIGSNDGIMLENFAKQGIKHLGVEPSGNVAEVARSHGVNTVVSFFTPTLTNKIIEEYGHADVLIAANVMCHIPDLNVIAESAHALLKPSGVLIFEDPYLGAMIEKTSYDQIYDEHVYIFSALSVQSIFSRHGFELIDVLPQSTHGGSMRYVLSKKGSRIISPGVNKLIEEERLNGLHLKETYEKFRINCEESRSELIRLLEAEKLAGNRVVGYGATSKSTTVLNFCNISSDLIQYISDTTPIKQGKYSPGMHIPVKAYEDLWVDPPDCLVLFAWNHAEEIMLKEAAFTEAGGRWIVHVPKVQVIK